MFLVLIFLWASANASCPPGTTFDPIFFRCYKFEGKAESFFAAEQSCLVMGGHLVSVKSSSENALFYETFSNITEDNISFFWIGANHLTSLDWSWTDGAAFYYTNWNDGQGCTDLHGYCGSLEAETGLWKANDCNSEFPYVCSLPPVVEAQCPGTLPSTESPATCLPQEHVSYCTSGWTYFSESDSCYHVFPGGNFSSSEAHCVKHGAHLTSIHSPNENTFVSELASTFLSLSDHAQMTWIGLHNVTGVWEWTDNTPYDPELYKEGYWSKGEPNNKGNERCVELYSDSSDTCSCEKNRWNDKQCQTLMRAMVCKKPALRT